MLSLASVEAVQGWPWLAAGASRARRERAGCAARRLRRLGSGRRPSRLKRSSPATEGDEAREIEASPLWATFRGGPIEQRSVEVKARTDCIRVKTNRRAATSRKYRSFGGAVKGPNLPEAEVPGCRTIRPSNESGYGSSRNASPKASQPCPAFGRPTLAIVWGRGSREELYPAAERSLRHVC
jgi:hypothetical protein